MFNLLVVGVIFFVITALVTIYCMFEYSARLNDIEAQNYDSQVNDQL